MIALSNSNYAMGSAGWDQPAPATSNVGAVTWCNGTSGYSGVGSSANSMLGSGADDLSGDGLQRLLVLENGSYSVSSPLWEA